MHRPQWITKMYIYLDLHYKVRSRKNVSHQPNYYNARSQHVKIGSELIENDQLTQQTDRSRRILG